MLKTVAVHQLSALVELLIVKESFLALKQLLQLPLLEAQVLQEPTPDATVELLMTLQQQQLVLLEAQVLPKLTPGATVELLMWLLLQLLVLLPEQMMTTAEVTLDELEQILESILTIGAVMMLLLLRLR